MISTFFYVKVYKQIHYFSLKIYKMNKMIDKIFLFLVDVHQAVVLIQLKLCLILKVYNAQGLDFVLIFVSL